jgi:HAD superfamily hydrolase (TIGR01450 family)
MNDIIPRIDRTTLLERYNGLLLDAFGVLVDKQGPLPGAIELLDTLTAEGKPWFILTNSASRLPETMERHYQEQGFAIPLERIISSGMLLDSYFRDHNLAGARTLVLGPDNSQEYARRAGAEVVPLDYEGEVDVVVIADQAGYDLLTVMNHAMSLILHQVDQGKVPHLVLCNPDIIYPVAEGRYGFTAGGLAAMIDAILLQRYPDQGIRFTPLGKPHAPIFAEGVKRIGNNNVVMIGDQLATDIKGARDFGIDSILVNTGLTMHKNMTHPDHRPTWFTGNLAEL